MAKGEIKPGSNREYMGREWLTDSYRPIKITKLTKYNNPKID
jgi:hypothetical protein